MIRAMIRGYDSGRSHLLPFEATQHTKKGQTHIYIYIYMYIFIYLPITMYIYIYMFVKSKQGKQADTVSLLQGANPHACLQHADTAQKHIFGMLAGAIAGASNGKQHPSRK